MNEQLIFQLLFEIGGQPLVDQFRASLDATRKSAEGMSPGLKAAADEIDALTNKASKIEAFAALKAQTNETANSLAAAKAGLAALNAEFDRGDTSSVKVTRAFAQAEQQVARLTTQHNSLSAQLQRSGADLQRAGISTSNLAGAHAELSSKIAGSVQNFISLTNSSGQHVSALERIKQGATSVGGAIKNVGEFALSTGRRLLEISGIAGVVTTALAAISGFKFFETGAEEASALDTSLAKLRATTNATGDELERLQRVAEEAGKATNTSATESVDALASLTSELGNQEAAVDALVPTLTLAKAAQISVADAVKVVTDSLKAFQIPASQSKEVVDLLAATALKTDANLGALTQAFGQLAPEAHELGFSFRDTVAVLGLLQTRGLSAEQASKSLRTAFAELANHSSQLSKDLAGLGIKTDSLENIIDGLAKAGPRGTEALQSLGAKGGNALLTLVQEGVGGLQQFQARLGDTAGAAKRTADILDDTIRNAAGNIRRDFRELAGDAVAGGIDPLKNELEKLDNEIKTVSNTTAFQRIKQAIADFVAEGVKKIDEFIHSFDFESASKSIADFVTGAAQSFKSIGEGFGAVKTVVSGVVTTIGAAVNVVQTFFYGVASATDLFIAGLLKAYQSLRVIGGASLQELQTIQEQVDTYYESAKEFNEKSANSYENLKDKITSFADAVLASGNAAKDAAPKHQEHAAAVEKTGSAVDEARRKYDALPASIRSSLPPFEKLLEAANRAAAAGKTSGEVIASASEKADDAAARAAAAFQNQQQKIIAARDAADQARAKLEALAQSGDANTDAFRAAQAELAAAERELRNLTSSADAAKPSLHDLKAAFSELGIQSQQALQQAADNAKNAFDTIQAGSDGSKAALADEQNAFLAYAQKRLAASAQLGDAARQQVKEELESKAAILDITGALADLEKQSDSSQAATTSDAQRAAAALNNEANAARRLANSFSGGGGGGGGGKPLDEATRKATEEIHKYGDDGGESLAKLDEALANTRQSFLNLSPAAAKAFDAHLVSDFNSAVDSTGIGLGRVISAMNSAAAETQRDVANQRKQLDELIDSLNNTGQAGRNAFGGIDQYAGKSVEEIQAMIDSIKNGTSQFNLLGQQDLSRLLSALDAAKQKAEAAAQAAKQAADEFDNLAKSIHDQLLQEQGDQLDLENERHQEELAKLKELADEGKIDAQKYAQAVADENALHELKLQHIEEQQQKDAEAKKQQQQQPTGGGGGGSGGGSGSGGGQQQQGGGGGFNGQQQDQSGKSGGVSDQKQPPALHPITINLGDLKAQVHATPSNADILQKVLSELIFSQSRS